MNIQPIGQRILITPIQQQEKTASGIYLPTNDKEKKKEGIVEQVGTDEHGKPLPLQKGDHILYGGYSNEEFEFNNKTYVIIEYKDVLAKVN